MTTTDNATIDGEMVEPVLDTTEEPLKKTTKKSAVKKPKTVFPSAEIIPNPAADPAPNDKERTGEFIRRLLLENVYTSNEIIAAVQEHYVNSKIKIGDVAYWRHQLRSDGHKLKVVTYSQSGVRYTR